MPVYEYACEKCGHEFERQQRITEDPVKTCPVCKAKKVRRLISRTAFVLKGGGWYSDLYSSAKPGTEAGTKSEGESSAPAASGGSDAKSEAKPETAPKPSGGKGKGKSNGKSAKAA